MTDEQRIANFISACSRAMVERAVEPKHVEGAAALADRMAASTPHAFDPSWLPSLDTINLVQADADRGFTETTDLARDFVAVAPLLPWVPTMRATDGGTDFALAPLNDVRDFGDAIVGLMYVRPDTQYPLHQHPPQELYLIISGTAEWRFGGHEDLRELRPGDLLYNNPDDLHTVTAWVSPVVALYVLWP